jgi:cytochrome c biogenesis protein CcdA
MPADQKPTHSTGHQQGMDLVLGYLAGIATFLNPCVLPILPIVLVSAIQQDRLGPVALVAGMAGTFVVVGFGLSAIGPALGIDERIVSWIAALMMVGFGLVLLVPRFNAAFATATAGFSTVASMRLDRAGHSGLWGQVLAGVLLGAVWSPCIGPTLGGAIALASQGENLVFALAIMVAFALGVATVMLALAYGTREAIIARQKSLRAIAEKSKPIAGAVLVAVGLMILFGVQHYIEGWLLDVLPVSIQDLSVSI